MRTLRTMGIVGAAAVLLLLVPVAFAQRDPGTATSSAARVQAVREEAQARVSAERAKVAERLANIRDTAKQQMAQRLATQFGELNSKWTAHFAQLLDRYDALLTKVQDRANVAAGNGKDITAVTAAITSARTAIADARTAVTAQAGKTYELASSAISASATGAANGQSQLMQNLRQSFKDLHQSLFKDLTALRDGPMKNARAAVQVAIRTLGQIPGVDDDRAAPPTQTSD